MTTHTRDFTFRGDAEALDHVLRFCSDLTHRLRHVEVTIKPMGASRVLGYTGFFNRRARVSQDFRITGTLAQVNATAESVRKVLERML